jgi:arylsulfatase
MYAAQFVVRQFLDTFKEFPARMEPASFSIDKALAKLEQAMHSN